MAGSSSSSENVVEVPKTGKALDEITSSNEKVVIDCYYMENSMCVENKHLMKKHAKEHSDIKFVRADTEYLQAVVQCFPVDSYPTYLFVKNGRIVDRLVMEDHAELGRVNGRPAEKVSKENVKRLVKEWVAKISQM